MQFEGDEVDELKLVPTLTRAKALLVWKLEAQGLVSRTAVASCARL